MRFENDGPGPGLGPFEDIYRLQSDFQRRMAEETLKYLRQLQGMVGPVVPGTIVSPDPDHSLSGTVAPGRSVSIEFDVENRQRVHSMVTPMLGPLINDKGVTWFPAAGTTPATALVPPGATQVMTLRIDAPRDIEEDTYRGVLMLYGFRRGGIPIEIEVARPGRRKKRVAKRRTKTKAKTRTKAKAKSGTKTKTSARVTGKKTARKKADPKKAGKRTGSRKVTARKTANRGTAARKRGAAK